jgi:hypothetical protein
VSDNKPCRQGGQFSNTLLITLQASACKQLQAASRQRRAPLMEGADFNIKFQ